MEELKDASIHHTALKLANEIKIMNIYQNLYKMVQVMYIKKLEKYTFYVSS